MPVSISYPEGDPGREDEIIREVEAHTGIVTNWLSVDDIPLFGDAAEEAARRDVPFAHAYEHWNRTLSRTASEAGARVMLDGSGGDQLFQVSDIFLSDLFGRGRWIELARQWRGRGGHGVKNLWRWAVHPAIPVPLERLLARARKMPPRRHHFERQPPIWFVPRFLSAHGVLERERAAAPKLPRSSRVLGETHAYLRIPYFPRIANTLHAFALEEGVELRSPLLDTRVVQFATRRPWSERADRAETKILLRRAMTGLLPASVLAPRKRRTGITSAYFLRQMRGPGRPLVESLLQDPLLASIGMIDVPRLRRAWEHVLQHDNDEIAARIFFTLQAELWLRAHAGPSGSATSAPAVRS
jgi:asparagine synthase (glutamine-hydrolysing)